MAQQLLLGFGMIMLSIVIQLCFIEIAAHKLKRNIFLSEGSYPGFLGFISTLTRVSFWLLISIAIIISLWSYLLYQLDIFTNWEDSLNFTMISFTTLGVEDVAVPDQWRLLAGFIGADGFVVFGLYTAVLVETMSRLHDRPSK